MSVKNLTDTLETETDYKTLFEKSAMGMAIIEADNTISLANKRVAQLLKTDLPTILKSSLCDWISDVDKERLKEYRKQVAQQSENTPENYEFRLVCQDKSINWALVNLTLFQDSGKILLSVLNISKLKETEKKLKEAISSQNAIFLAVPDLMFELDSHGVYLNIWANNPEELAATKEQLLGHTVAQMLPNEAAKQVMVAIRDTKEKGHSFGRQIHIQTPHGKQWFELSISLKHNEDTADTFIVLSRNISDRKELETELIHLSRHDALTGLYNRRVLEDRLTKDIQRASRYSVPLSICMLDIDHFKGVNDTYGHQVGDRVLKRLAKLLEELLRTTDYTARYGGEEFLVVLPDTDLSSAKEFAKRLRIKVEEMQIELENAEPFQITVSIGVSTFGKEASSLDKIIDLADSAMYLAKRSGRNRVISFDSN
ncbi:MAG: diguanylate cyclase [Campylobacterota bacterium]|nr:diguanylate cyclase [Campylobacterota bacterium]